MYIRTSQGKQEFSSCKSIKLIYAHADLAVGQWVSNPDAELIASEDWVEYIPPVPEPTPQTEPTSDEIAKQLLTLNSVKTEIVALDDEAALEVIALFPAWVEQIGKEVHTGERYYYDEKLWKVLQDHTVQESWTPDTAPSLFVRVTIEEWPEWVQPVGSTDAYNTGDKVSHNDQHWTSDVGGNVWEPGVYGWTQVE